MRTFVTLDPDTEQIVRRRMRERNMSLEEAINDAIRAGSASAALSRQPFRTQTANMGESVVVDQALEQAANSEDVELVRRMRSDS